MASLQIRNGSFRLQFRYHGKLHGFTLGRVTRDEADAKARQVEYLLMRLRQKLVHLPDHVDIVSFVEHDGQLPESGPALPTAPRQPVTLGRLRDRYAETHENGTVEANTLYTRKIHFAHLTRVLGDGLPVGEVTVAALQDYVNRRAKEKVRPVTIRKELSTLRAAWQWGVLTGLAEGKLPNQGLRYPKADAKPPFMTMTEIARQIAAGEDADELWESLYLKADEVAELLEYVRTRDALPWVYPLFCFAGHTGARRSEIVRVKVADLDFAANVVTIRERKRSAGERTSRRVPLSPFLRRELEAWLTAHPGGTSLFCHDGIVGRSKKRSQSTGYQSEVNRPTSLRGRMATVTRRTAPDQVPLTVNEVHHFFKAVLRGGKWEPVRGLHTLRHSFVSACASKGVDQRLVEAWAGHMSADMSRRYAHLWPSTQQAAINAVFGE